MMVQVNDKKSVSINTFVFLLIVSTLLSMAAIKNDNIIFRWGSYLSEICLIAFTLLKSDNKWMKQIPIVLCSTIVLANYIISPYEHNYSELLKFFGYLCCFSYGKTLARRYRYLKTGKLLIFALVFIPLLIVAVFDSSVRKNSFFISPNTFVYSGLILGLFYYILNYEGKNAFIKAWLIVALHILICTSLGIVVAIVVSYILLNLKKGYLLYFLLAGGVLLFAIAIMYIDIPLFIRVRDVIHLWTSLSKSDWVNLRDTNLYELGQSVNIEGGRSDTTSSLWRLVQWSNLLSEYFSKIWPIPFGFGVGFSRDLTGLQPHNDYILIATEYGAVVLIFFLSFIKRVYARIKKEGSIIYFILPVFLYHFTENLIHNFSQNAILYFVIGWCIFRFNPIRETYESTSNK